MTIIKRLIKWIKWLAITVGSLIALVLISYLGLYVYEGAKSSKYAGMAGPVAPTLIMDRFEYSDLNKNGRLDVYEDSREPIDARIEDLLDQMTIEEKAGLMFISHIAVGQDGELQGRPVPTNFPSLIVESNAQLIHGRLMNHFTLMTTPRPQLLATWANNLQEEARKTRLGIPVTIGSDPRHGFAFNVLASIISPDFSIWPEPIGLAATRDPQLVREFGDIARREYVATGIRLALHPMADLSTEPRWARSNGTFGSNADLASEMVYEYIKGFQGESLGAKSVATMVKHYPGSGAREDGHDSHFDYGKFEIFPGDNFDYHLRPFTNGAFRADVASVMTAYGIQRGISDFEVGASFNPYIVKDLLRQQNGFDGAVTTDFGIVEGIEIFGAIPLIGPMPWGVENLTPSERVKILLDNDVDQVGGSTSTNLIVDLVKSGEISESRLDRSAARLLRQKFELGLFDNPYVDASAAEQIAGNSEFREAGVLAQKKSIVLLKNGNDSNGPVLPLKRGLRVYAENIDPDVLSRYASVVESVENADIAILRLSAPYEPKGGFPGMFLREGDLDYKREEKARILEILNAVPTVVDIYLDRPAVIPEVAEGAAALTANFGAFDYVILDVLFGEHGPTGRLPFELPGSMASVENQLEDVPDDSGDPLYPYGFGLEYAGNPD